jgi:hypothetical protein
MRRALVAVLLSLSLPAFAQFEPPLGVNHAVAGPRTAMLTIASTHLSGHSGKWSKGWLEPLVQRLVAYRPELITIEQLSGSQCEIMRGNPAVFGEVFEAYCRDATPFQRLLRMTQPQAAAEAERQLAAWPTSPTPTQRRHLTMLFLAAGDFGSAKDKPYLWSIAMSNCYIPSGFDHIGNMVRCFGGGLILVFYGLVIFVFNK